MPQKPVWSEGVLVSQHHFQQQDRYHEQLLRDRVSALVHYDWGITELELDMRALASNELRILRFRAIWPDGASIRAGEGYEQPAPEPRNFAAAFTADLSKLEIFVGLVHEGESTAILNRPQEPQEPRRYVQDVEKVSDLNTGTSPLEIEWCRPNLRVFVGNERRDGYSTIRIAELVRQGSGQTIVRDNYVPPVLHIETAPFLRAGLQRVLTVANAQRKALASERSQKQAGSVEFHSAAAQTFWFLHTLNGAIPRLSHLLETPRAHPEEVYVALVDLVGQLSSFVADSDPMSLPKFNYLELGDVFESLFARAVSMISGDRERPYTEIELERRPDGMYLGKLRDPKLAARELFVAVRANLVEAVVRDRVPAVLKVAAWNQIYNVVKQAVRGVRVEVEWNPSAALPVRPGTCFFRIRREGQFWDEIKTSSSIALYLPSDGDWSGASIAIYAIDAKHLG
jgi:type VI secretion system protein ImpJ